MTGIGIGGMTDMVSAMVLSNYVNNKDKIKLFIEDTGVLQNAITVLAENVKLALKDYQERLRKYGTCTCNHNMCKECNLKNMTFTQF